MACSESNEEKMFKISSHSDNGGSEEQHLSSSKRIHTRPMSFIGLSNPRTLQRIKIICLFVIEKNIQGSCDLLSLEESMSLIQLIITFQSY